jgi:hypothetical protein
MKDIEAKEIITQIIQQAEEQKGVKPHIINTLSEYLFYLDQEKSLKVVLKILRNCADYIFKEYCKEVVAGNADFTKMLAFKEFHEIIIYYNQELLIVKGMLGEYYRYLTAGNFINAFLGEDRGI